MNFEFYSSSERVWHWNITAYSGEVVSASVNSYPTRQECINAIEYIMNNILLSRIYDRDEDRWL